MCVVKATHRPHGKPCTNLGDSINMNLGIYKNIHFIKNDINGSFSSILTKKVIKKTGKNSVFLCKPIQTLKQISSVFIQQTDNSNGNKYGSRDFKKILHRTVMRSVCVCAALKLYSLKLLKNNKNTISNILSKNIIMSFDSILHSKDVVLYQTITFSIRLSNYIVSMLLSIKLHSRGFLL